MKDTRYAFCVAKIRANENRLLTKQDINFLVDCADLASAFGFLVKKCYAEENENISQLVKRQGDELDKLLSECVPDVKELRKLYILNDYFNIKVLVKCALENREAEEFITYPSSVCTADIIKSSQITDFYYLNEEYRDIAKKAYNIALLSGNGKYSDVIIDKAAINALSSLAKEKNSGMYGKICALLADFANIKIALRSAATHQDADYINEAIGDCNTLDKSKLISASVSGFDDLVAYLETTSYKEGVSVYIKNPSAFEKWCDDRIIEITHAAIYTSFGFAPVVSYFYRKTLEIKTVRMILSAIKSGVSKAEITKRVREHYA